jgi:hypothetical protein
MPTVRSPFRSRRPLLAAAAAIIAIATAGSPAPARAESAAGAVVPPKQTVLFIGNSFTFGANSPVWRYRADTVTDLNGEGVGGVPALFKLLASEMGLDYDVYLETSGGKTLKWHWDNKAKLLDRPWDHVVMQEYSTLSPDKPGDPAGTIAYAKRFAGLFASQNPKVDISMSATWSRPDLTYQPGKPWTGRSIYQMALDVRRGYDRAAATSKAIRRVNPVGQAFNCAIAAGVADPNPYDGIAPEQVDLWSYDHYHASTAGYYLEALTVLGAMTGQDPRRFGPNERGAMELGLSPTQAVALQTVAARQLYGEPCDAPIAPRR